MHIFGGKKKQIVSFLARVRLDLCFKFESQGTLHCGPVEFDKRLKYAAEMTATLRQDFEKNSLG